MTYSEPLCPSSYCGVASSNITDILQCAACKWGYKPDELSVCRRCMEPLPMYDWFYLGFMALLSFVLHCVAIDVNTNRKSRRMVLQLISALLESVSAAVASLLIMTPSGEFTLYSCGANSIQDWYTVFYNPTIKHSVRLHCTQESVYPLYTIVMIYYSLQLPAMLIFRPIFANKKFSKQGVEIGKPIYNALYFLPLLVLVQAVLGGVVYYIFPYAALLISTITLVIHLSNFDDQNSVELLRASLCNGRSLSIILIHWIIHGYGILSLTAVDDVVLAACLLLLVPVPYILYILTSRFTDPEVIDRQHTE